MLEIIGNIFATSTIATLAVTFLLKVWLTSRIQKDVEYTYQKKFANYKAEIDERFEKYKSAMKSLELISQTRWEIKRQTCLEALEVVDTAFSHISWEYPSDMTQPISGPTLQETADIAKARACHNKLAITCDSNKVIEKYLACLGIYSGVGPGRVVVHMDSIVELREAIREELKFSIPELDRTLVWISTIPTSNPEKAKTTS